MKLKSITWLVAIALLSSLSACDMNFNTIKDDDTDVKQSKHGADAPQISEEQEEEDNNSEEEDDNPTNKPDALDIPAPSNGITFTVCGVKFAMVNVEGGSFQMGVPPEESTTGNVYKNSPVHNVTLSSYQIGQTEVTEQLYKAVMYNEDSDSQLPQTDLTYEEWQVFINKLNSLTNKKFRFPTEAEWEFAARGGTKSQGYQYSGSDNVDDVAWYSKNAKSGKKKVARKTPNELDIYDMSGNVFEWCSDFSASYFPFDLTNPAGPSLGSNRIMRGGAFYYGFSDCKTGSRNCLYNVNNYAQYVGMRLAMSSTNDAPIYFPIVKTGTPETLPLKIDGVEYGTLIKVDGGSFMMGRSVGEGTNKDGDGPIHMVTLRSYYILSEKVTYQLYKLINEVDYDTYEYYAGTNWYGASLFCERLSEITGKKFRLPTEAEWEYAVRGGQYSLNYKYPGSNEKSDSYERGCKNELGLQVCSGAEWCGDYAYDYTEESVDNPFADTPQFYRGYLSEDRIVRNPNDRYVSDRAASDNFYFFRIVMEID